jgi:hypothetical protein
MMDAADEEMLNVRIPGFSFHFSIGGSVVIHEKMMVIWCV